MDQKLWYIKNVGTLFANLSDADRQALADMSRMVECQRRHQLYLPGELSDKIYLVKKGMIRLGRISENGDEITLNVLGPGEIFGEMAVTDEKQRSHFAEATQDSLVCIFPRDQFQEFLNMHQDVTFKVMKLIGFRLREMETRLQDLTFQPVAQRLRKVLVRLGRKYGENKSDGTIRLTITQKDLAYLIGTTRESVAEELGRLKRAGQIETSYRSILLKNLDQLGPSS